MSIALGENRQERHLMRQRGAGARTITANFGFVFQAGPVQLQTPSDVQESIQAQQLNPSRQVKPPVAKTEATDRDTGEIADTPKKEKLIRSVKRTKLDPDQQAGERANEHIPDEVAPLNSQSQSKKTKRKPASKRFKALKPRLNRQVKEDSQTQTTNPVPQLKEEPPQPPALRIVQKQKAEEKPKPVATCTKRNVPKSKKDAPVEDADEIDELSNDSIPSIITSKPIWKKRTADVMTVEVTCTDTVAAKKKTKAASQTKSMDGNTYVTKPRKKKAATRTRGSRLVKNTLHDAVQQEEHSPGIAPISLVQAAPVDAPVPNQSPQEELQNLETTKRSKRTAATKPVKTVKMGAEDNVLPKDNLKPVKASPKHKRGKVTNDCIAEQADVIQSDNGINQEPEKVIAEPKKPVKARQTKRTKATLDDHQPKIANIEAKGDTTETSRPPANLTRSRKTKASKTTTSNLTQAIPEEANQDQESPKKPESTPQKIITRSKRIRQPLSTRDSNESPQKAAINPKEQHKLKASKPKTKPVIVKRSRNLKAIEEPVIHDISSQSPPPAPIGLGITIPEVDTVEPMDIYTESKSETEFETKHESDLETKFETKKRGSKKRKSIHVHEDLDGFFHEAPMLGSNKDTVGKGTVGKVTAKKRVFRDEEEEDVDLDDLLDGIALIAGGGTVGNSEGAGGVEPVWKRRKTGM